METSGAGLKPSAGRTVNVPDLIARSRWAVLEKRQRADCPLTDVTMLTAFLRMGNIFLHKCKPFDFMEEKELAAQKTLESGDD